METIDIINLFFSMVLNFHLFTNPPITPPGMQKIAIKAMKYAMNKIPAGVSAKTPNKTKIGKLAIRTAKNPSKIPFLIPFPVIKAAVKPAITHKMAEGK